MKNSAILLTVDRLGASYLGPYGNTWLETPTLNRLAAQCQLYEHVTAESLKIQDFATTVLSAQHKLQHSSPAFDVGLPLIRQLHNRGIPIVVFTDDPEVGELAQASQIEEAVLLENNHSGTADRLETTSLFDAFASAIALLESVQGPVWVWLHLADLGQVWDAPVEYRAAFCDEDDPLPWEEAIPPRMSITSNKDPDELFQLTMAYAAQVRVLDECLGLFWDQLSSDKRWDQALFIFGGTRGFPLGEHLRVGDMDEQLYGESLRLPLMIRNPQRPHSSRHLEQIQPVDWAATIADWFGVVSPSRDDRFTGKSLLQPSNSLDPLQAGIALSASESSAAVRTPAWFYTRHADRARLYVKPDDPWEINDVLDRCESIAKDLDLLLNTALAKGRSGELMGKFPEDLEHVMRHVE